MAKITGRIIDGIREAHNNAGAHQKLIRLSIDENGRDKELRKRTIQASRLQVISLCRDLKIPWILIQFNERSPHFLEDHTAESPGSEKVHQNPPLKRFTKGTVSAFHKDENGENSLHDFLTANGYKTLVVMGFSPIACVVETVGASKCRLQTGACQLNYKVLTCEQIINAGEANEESMNTYWNYDTDGLEFYTQV